MYGTMNIRAGFLQYYNTCNRNFAGIRPCFIYIIQSNKGKTFNYYQLHADDQMSASDQQEEHAARDVWKCITTERGERSAMTRSAVLTLGLSAGVLDSGRFACLQSIMKQHLKLFTTTWITSTPFCKLALFPKHRSHQRVSQRHFNHK